jgi:hypothetical protein
VADRRNDKDQVTQTDVDAPPADVTGEVASEGGSSGDVEVAVEEGTAEGSEATETWRPSDREENEIVRDETGQGRRNP